MIHEWSDALKTGHEPIDHKHEELFQFVSMLDSAIHHDSREKIEALVQFLEAYVDSHFKEEENLMKIHDYEGYLHHKEDHEIFKARVFSLRHDLDAGIPPSKLYFAIRMFIDKLIYHVQTVDIKIAKLHYKETP